MAELVAHTEQPAPRGSADSRLSDEWDLNAARYQAAARMADELWQQAPVTKMILLHLEFRLKHVRRMRLIYDWLEQFRIGGRLFVWVGLTLLTGYSVFADVGSGRFLLPALLALPAWADLRLQRSISAWLSSRCQDLLAQELTCLTCMNALARNRDDFFRQTIRALLRQPSTSW